MNAAAGFWSSRLDAAQAATAQLRYDPPQFGAGRLWWLEGDPAAGGRRRLCCFDGTAVDHPLPERFDVLSRVNGYGGRAWTVAPDGQVWFVNAEDQGVYRLGPHGRVARVLHAPRRSFADLAVGPGGRLIAVCEEEKARQYLVAIDAGGQLQRLHAGFDFYAAPRVSRDGRLAWVCWNHPHMPWDRSELWSGRLGSASWLGDAHRVAGGGDESWQQPQWSAGGRLHAMSDRNGFWIPWHEDRGRMQPLRRLRADCASPPWTFGRQTLALAADAHAGLVAVCRAGRWRLEGLCDGAEYRAPVTQIESVARDGDRIAILGASAEAATGIVLQDRPDGDWRWLSGGPSVLPEPVSAPRRLRVAGTSYPLRAWYFPPRNATVTKRRGERPPLVVKVHGGPTAAAAHGLDLRVQYWTSRGFAVLAVDYRGSANAGRKLRMALYGQWGRADVEDCRLAALDAVRRKLADPGKLFISGSSSGGLTALGALMRYRAFAGACSIFGVTDLVQLAAHTHRFEAHYCRRLIGMSGSLERRARQRSPLFHVDRIDAPVLFLHGTDDTIVPAQQARDMHAALVGRGLHADLVEFPGEGHGFESESTVARALELELAFYRRIMTR